MVIVLTEMGIVSWQKKGHMSIRRIAKMNPGFWKTEKEKLRDAK